MKLNLGLLTLALAIAASAAPVASSEVPGLVAREKEGFDYKKRVAEKEGFQYRREAEPEAEKEVRQADS